jgi:parvulin-like peptidyl-prolyl isomerase
MPNRPNIRSGATTRKQQIHSQRDRQSTRWVLIAFGGVFVAILLVLGFGILQTLVYQKNQPLGTVYGETITVGQYQQEFQYELWSAMDLYQEEYNFAKSSNLTIAQKSFYNQAQGVWLEYQTSKVKQENIFFFLEEAIVARHEAQVRGISVSDAEVEAKIQNQFGYIPAATLTAIPRSTATPTLLPTATSTPGGPTAMPSLTPSPAGPTPTATPDTSFPPTEKMYRDNYAEFLVRLSAKTGMSEQDFRERIRTGLLMEKVRLAVKATMPRVQTHVHLQQIVVVEESSAKAAAAQLAAGEDWVNVVRAITIDGSNRELAGDLGWVPIGNLDAMTAAAVNILKIGETSPPTKVTTDADGIRWYLFRVMEKGEREVDSANLDLAQKNFYDQWMAQLRADKTVFNVSGLPTGIIPKDPKPTS